MTLLTVEIEGMHCQIGTSLSLSDSDDAFEKLLYIYSSGHLNKNCDTFIINKI
jgi:hypothetical protein